MARRDSFHHDTHDGRSSSDGPFRRMSVDDSGTANSASQKPSDDLQNGNLVRKMDYARRQAAIDKLQYKIRNVQSLLVEEKNNQEGNVTEYLELLPKADKVQEVRIKSAFDKRNQKLMQKINHLQAKLDDYQKRLADLQSSDSEPQTDVLKNVGQGLNGKQSDLNFVLKPKELAQQLKSKLEKSDGHKRRAKVPSSDSNAKETDDSSMTNEPSDSMLAQLADDHMNHSAPTKSSRSGSESMRSGMQGVLYPNRALLAAVKELQQEQIELRELISSMKSQMKQDYENLSQILEAEREVCDHLDQQISDLSELHLNEVVNIKQEIASLEEKLVYSMEEETRDLHDQLDLCHTRITKMEVQQSQNQQIQTEGNESSFRIGTAINMVFNFIGFVLVVLSTVVGLLHPFISTRWRYFCTFFVILVSIIIWCNWESISQYYHAYFPL